MKKIKLCDKTNEGYCQKCRSEVLSSQTGILDKVHTLTKTLLWIRTNQVVSIDSLKNMSWNCFASPHIFEQRLNFGNHNINQTVILLTKNIKIVPLLINN